MQYIAICNIMLNSHRDPCYLTKAPLSLHCAVLHCNTLQYIAIQCIALQCYYSILQHTPQDPGHFSKASLCTHHHITNAHRNIAIWEVSYNAPICTPLLIALRHIAEHNIAIHCSALPAAGCFQPSPFLHLSLCCWLQLNLKRDVNALSPHPTPPPCHICLLSIPSFSFSSYSTTLSP